MAIDLSDTVTVQQAAKIKGVHSETILRWIRDDRLPAIKLGLMWYIKLNDLNQFNAGVV